MAAVSSTTAEDLRRAKADCRLLAALSVNPPVTSTPLSAVTFGSMMERMNHARSIIEDVKSIQERENTMKAEERE